MISTSKSWTLCLPEIPLPLRNECFIRRGLEDWLVLNYDRSIKHCKSQIKCNILRQTGVCKNSSKEIHKNRKYQNRKEGKNPIVSDAYYYRHCFSQYHHNGQLYGSLTFRSKELNSNGNVSELCSVRQQQPDHHYRHHYASAYPATTSPVSAGPDEAVTA